MGSAADVSQTQLTAMLAVLAAVFYLQYQRSREPMTLMWFWGWMLVLLRLVLLHIPATHGHPWARTREILCNLCVILPALIFIGSFSPDRLGRRIRIPYYAAMAIPIAIYTVLQGLWLAPTPMRSAALFALAVATMVVTGLWAMKPGYLPPALTLSVTGCALLISTLNIRAGNYGENIFLVTSLANIFTAFFLLRKYRERSAAVRLTAISFLLWAVWPWLHTVQWSGAAMANAFMAALGPIRLLAALGMVLLLLDAEIRANIRAKERERRARMEMGLYSTLDLNLNSGKPLRSVAGEVCRKVAAGSVFEQAALLLPDPENHLYLAGHCGMEVGMASALDALGRGTSTAQLARFIEERPGMALAGSSFRLDLRPLLDSVQAAGDNLPVPGLASIVAVPMYSAAGLMRGAFLLAGQRSDDRLHPDDLLAVEALASKLAIAIENDALTQRIMQSHKLAGLGRLAGGVAHELNNPLTVVMGYAEMIAEMAGDRSIREQAAIIHAESLRMKRIIESLIRFWKPSPQGFQQVEVGDILRDIHRLRAPELERSGIALHLTIADNLPTVPGNEGHLKQVFLQLLNNSVDAIQRSEAGTGEHKRHRIRMDLSLHLGRLHILFSDTGSGFADPSRVFDPFFTTKQPGSEGAGLGLSMCYSVAREHRGEISAFNMPPDGAAVVLELPVDTEQEREMEGASAVAR